MSQLRANPLLLFFFLLAFISLILYQANYLQPVESLAINLITPAQNGLSHLMKPGEHLWLSLRQAGELQERNRELQDLVDTLMIENVRLREKELENIMLREQLNFKQANPTYDLVSAEIIGKDPSNLLHYLIVDRGADDGLAQGMPVVSARGLVGRITDVARNSAKVLLITDPSSSVNALVQESRATGMVEGSLSEGLLIRYVPQGEKIEVGNLILTSGLGATFPKGLVIGQVTSVHQQDIELFQNAVIRPSVDFNTLEMVMVIRNFSPAVSE
ncbi:MAG: rod shape-determining protein MreC [Anaerolineae bacterium]